MSASTVKKPDRYQKRVSKFVKVVCKRLQPFRGIFKEKTDPISKNVVSFKNHKVNVVLGSHFIRFRQNILTSFCINEAEHNQIELVTKYLSLIKSPFVTEQITFCLAKETEGNSESAVINFLPNQKLNATLDLEMAQLKMHTNRRGNECIRFHIFENRIGFQSSAMLAGHSSMVCQTETGRFKKFQTWCYEIKK